MRTSLAISSAGHAAVLLWGALTFAAQPYKSDLTEAFPANIISLSDFSKLTSGTKTAAPAEQAKPFAERIGERKPVDDPTAKVAEKKEIKAAIDAPPPIPALKPAAPAPKAQPQPKRDLIAEALQNEDTKKPEPKRADAKTPMPPKRPQQMPPQPAFDPKKVEALLDKRVPQRLAATGDAINNTVSMGAPSTMAALLSQSELDALRARLGQLWTPPAGAKNAEELIVQVRIRLSPDGRLADWPIVTASGKSTIAVAARESAVRAILRGQPFDMLKPEHYEQWKDIEITFDPRDMIRG
jgi:colicin import membrane protein